MRIQTKQVLLGLAAAGVLGLAYFVIFPEDLAAILGPLGQVLGLSAFVSPWLYAIIGVGILCWTAIRIWGGRSDSQDTRQLP